MDNKPVTIRDIAREAGCSHTTVSLALRSHYRIPPATRESIQSLAARMGYRTNPHIQTLLSQVRMGKVSRQAGTLALVSNYNKREQWRQMTNNNLAVLGAYDRAQELGYQLEEFSLKHDGMSFKRLRSVLIARGIFGILVAPTPDKRLEFDMDANPFALVSMGQSLSNRQISMVSHHHAHTMRTLLQSLQKRGYRRIACFIDAAINQRIEDAWSSPFYNYQMSLPKAQRLPLCLTETARDGEAFRVYLQKHKPDLVLSDRDSDLKLLREFGYSVPDDIGFASLSVTPGNQSVSGIEQNNRLTGIRAIELLVQSINHADFGIPVSPQYVYIPGKWIEGTTLKA